VEQRKIFESTVIINPTLEEPQIEAVISSIEEQIVKNGGTVRSIERWGRKRLSYPIAKRNNGYYALFEIEADGTLITNLERNYQYDDNIMRYLTVRLDQKALEAKEKLKLKPQIDEKGLEIEEDLAVGSVETEADAEAEGGKE
jgi:small subunit ribosomal protein S6